MAEITVRQRFYDMRKGRFRNVGEVFEATDGRAEEILRRLPEGYVDVSRKAKAEGKPDLTKMTLAELKALCAERGVKVPSGATKAKLAALLG